MTRTVWVETYDNASELTDTTIYHPMKFSENRVVRYIRAVLVFIGAPSFTNLRMNIYANDENSTSIQPSKLIHTSETSYTFSDLMTEDSGWKDTYFKFNDFHMKKDVWYHCVLSADTYVSSANSLLGIEKAWPNPIQNKGYTATFLNLPSSPYKVYAISGEL